MRTSENTPPDSCGKRFCQEPSVHAFRRLVPGERRIDCIASLEIAWRWCPPGAFLCGSPRWEWEKGKITWKHYDETQHLVRISSGFWMLETPVTLNLFRLFVDETGYEPGKRPYTVPSWVWNPKTSKFESSDAFRWDSPGLIYQNDEHPVTLVHWCDVNVFAQWLSRKLGVCVTLPTEAQWEYACRAGTNDCYHFGTKLNGEQANCYGRYPFGTTQKGPFLCGTSPVAQYPPNPWGLYDMHGNVWEWCRDWYAPYPAQGCDKDGSKCEIVDPKGPKSGLSRIFRGGSWLSKAVFCRAAYRGRNEELFLSNDLGFRLVCVPFHAME
ncbi:MAG: formylglycine-generating enzyme family protein [Planctomycetia bacterium]|nr:formylglycine-generating enzyme family protein [Planctomycetia bacterium]